LRPIGFARTPHAEKADAPRQPRAAEGVPGVLELRADLVDGLADLEGFDRIIVIFGFDRAHRTSSLKVLPPRSTTKRGVFATRSPHRPNPIGISILRLVRVDRTTIHVLDVDLLDGTPIYDVKPYLAYTDAFPDARAGWLEGEGPKVVGAAPEPRDPKAPYEVVLTDAAREACAFVERETGLGLERRIRDHLGLGPEPHAYRRIRREGDTSVLAVKEWRAVFVARTGEKIIDVVRVRSGQSPRDLARGGPELEVHRAFVARFG
jgi:tRNA-Thr(GGU) m(6)t(6)A37 methyltransferase TsaA